MKQLLIGLLLLTTTSYASEVAKLSSGGSGLVLELPYLEFGKVAYRALLNSTDGNAFAIDYGSVQEVSVITNGEQVSKLSIDGEWVLDIHYVEFGEQAYRAILRSDNGGIFFVDSVKIVPPCPELITPFDPDSHSATASPGYGFDGDRDRLKPASCLNGFEQPVSSGGRISVLSADQITGYENLYNSLEGSKTKAAEVSVGFFYKVFDIGIGGGGSDTKRFLSTVTNTKLSQSFVYRFEMLSSNNEFKLDTTQSSSLNELGKRLEGNACQFRATCGDQFVYQTERGVSLYVALTFNFNSEAQKQTFHKEMSGHFGMTLDKIGSLAKKSLFEVQADWSGFTNRISESLKQSSTLSITAAQIGGDVAALTTIMRSSEGTAAISCSLNSVDGCKQTIDNIIDYAASEAFVDGARNAPAVLNYLYQPYAAVGVFIPGLTFELNLDIKNMRERLATAYKERDEAYKTASFLESYNLTDAHQQAIDIIKENLSIDLKKIRDAANICFSDLSRCVDEGEKTLRGLTDYDEKVLEFQLDDGLLAYYPFDGDVQDAVGRRGSGILKGAVLAEDRFGSTLSACKFDGENDYISMPAIGKTDVSNFTISTWFKMNAHNVGEYGRSYILDLRGDGSSSMNCALIVDRAAGSNAYLEHACGWPVSRTFSEFHEEIENIIGEWHHTALVREGSILKGYLNGVLISNNPTRYYPSTSEPIAWNNAWRVGTWGEGFRGNDYWFNGSIDDIRIYNRALSDSEIQALYNLK